MTPYWAGCLCPNRKPFGSRGLSWMIAHHVGLVWFWFIYVFLSIEQNSFLCLACMSLFISVVDPMQGQHSFFTLMSCVVYRLVTSAKNLMSPALHACQRYSIIYFIYFISNDQQIKYNNLNNFWPKFIFAFFTCPIIFTITITIAITIYHLLFANAFTPLQSYNHLYSILLPPFNSIITIYFPPLFLPNFHFLSEKKEKNNINFQPGNFFIFIKVKRASFYSVIYFAKWKISIWMVVVCLIKTYKNKFCTRTRHKV